MWKYLIVEEARIVYEEHARFFGHDLNAMYDDLKENERRSKRTIAGLPPKLLEDKQVGLASRDSRYFGNWHYS
jgi:hypothetical protein